MTLRIYHCEAFQDCFPLLIFIFSRNFCMFLRVIFPVNFYTVAADVIVAITVSVPVEVACFTAVIFLFLLFWSIR